MECSLWLDVLGVTDVFRNGVVVSGLFASTDRPGQPAEGSAPLARLYVMMLSGVRRPEKRGTFLT